MHVNLVGVGLSFPRQVRANVVVQLRCLSFWPECCPW